MMDEMAWQQERAEFDAFIAAHIGRSMPPRELKLHMALAMARHTAMKAEIGRIIEEAKNDPEIWARLNQPFGEK